MSCCVIDALIVPKTSGVLSALAQTSDPRRHVAVGGPGDIVARIEEFKAAGVSKFVLRPIARGDDEMFAQTERLIADVLPPGRGV